MTVAPDPGFAGLLEKIERERGFCCAAYKTGCLERRIRTRMRAKSVGSYEAFSALLDREPREMDRLVDMLTINVTRFFRNAHVWDAIRAIVVPDLWRSQIETVRVWSAGSASGEEAYSMAMLFHRHAAVEGMLNQIGRVVVTGTDVDANAVRAAKRGAYAAADLQEVPDDVRQRYFSDDAPYRPSPGVRRLVRFVTHDLLKDPYPAAPQHIIICRNVLIYFDRAVQQQVIGRFRESLEPGGYLILGKVETLLGTPGFERVGVKERIFRKVS
jgi:chemotaxis methyl-accepting protein methylase